MSGPALDGDSCFSATLLIRHYDAAGGERVRPELLSYMRERYVFR